jgi:hypothetical protein
MSEQKKYIGKKRHKIFSIEKNYIESTPKKLSNKKTNINESDDFINSNEIPIENPQKICLNLDESNDKISTDTQKHSLIYISKLVFEYIKNIIYTTGNEVTEHIKNILQSKKDEQLNQKNIQRRVYDAINVMSAIGLIKKNKQKIQYIKEDKENLNKEINENKEKIKEGEIDIDEKIREKLNELEEKRKKLAKGYIKIKFYEKYSFLNNKISQKKAQNKLEFPFDIIKYNNSSPIKITSKKDSSRYLLLSNSVFVHLTPYDIIKKLIAPEILLKINENGNINLIDCKSSSKKSTNDNSLIDELNYNINNNEIIEKNKEETPKKNRIFSRFNINKQQTPKKSKEEKEEEQIFNYLKNKKCFIDELLNTNEPQEELINYENNNEIKNKEEPENITEKENLNFIYENRPRKNSNMSYESNFYDENTIKRNKEDLISEIEMFM